MSAKKLTPEEIQKEVAALDGWTVSEDQKKISKSYVFKDFGQAFGIMTRIALLAEQMNHHPEWFNVYNRLSVTLSTHDVDGLSELDITMARHIDAYTA